MDNDSVGFTKLFQSLLWWISFRRKSAACLKISTRMVSILVVVDQFPEGQAAEAATAADVGFNPCCGGSVSGGKSK